MTDSEGVSSYIQDSNDNLEYPIGGAVSDNTLKNKAGNSSYTVYKQGRSTCRDSGWIEDYTAHWDGKTITCTPQADDGDSGGPIFHLKENNGTTYAYIAGIIGWSANNDTDVRATAAETAENTLDADWV